MNPLLFGFLFAAALFSVIAVIAFAVVLLDDYDRPGAAFAVLFVTTVVVISLVTWAAQSHPLRNRVTVTVSSDCVVVNGDRTCDGSR